MQMLFDTSGLLVARSGIDAEEPLGSGLAVQFSVSVLSGIDTRYLGDGEIAHDFGAGLLLPPLELLNRGSDLDSGQHGVEQRGSPTGAGQRTLELR